VNVNDRIQILAGREYGLSFTSEKGVGTSARIVLPKTLKGA
jgi:sensor histidine kinase YesM